MSRGVSRYAATVLCVALLFSGCAGDDGQQRGTRPPPQEPASAGTMSPGGAVEADEPGTNMGEGSYWSSAGGESGGSEGASDRIRGVEFEVHEGYERLVIDFSFDEVRTTGIPRWSVEKSPQGGYLRLYLPGVAFTQTAGEDLAGLVADAYHVVRKPEDRLFVDVLALGTFEYRVTELAESGRLALDFRNAPGGLTCPAVQAENTVVAQPCEAEEVVAGEPLAVEGYARDPENALSAVLLDEEGDPMASESIRAGDGDGAWGYFEAEITAPSSYEGLATLRISDGGPLDGASPRAEVPVFFGAGLDE